MRGDEMVGLEIVEGSEILRRLPRVGGYRDGVERSIKRRR
jgi:hypothetical protein